MPDAVLSTLPLALLLAGPSPPVGPEFVLGGAVDDLVAGAGLVAVVQHATVRVLREDGSPVGRPCPEDDTRRTQPLRRAKEIVEILDQHGVSEQDRDSPEAEDLVDDELPLAARSLLAHPAGEPLQPLLAASEEGIWVACRDALWHVDSAGRMRRVAAVRPPYRRLAAGGALLYGAAGDRIDLSRDGGASFRPFTRADGVVHALTAAPDGRVAWATAQGTTQARPEGPLPGRAPAARDLRYCQGTLLTLGSGAVASQNALVPLPGPAARLACGPALPGNWVAADPGLVVGSGTDWPRPRRDTPGVRIRAVAVGIRALWVGTRDGVLALPPVPTSSTPRPFVAQPPETRRSAWWGTLLPRVVLAASARNSGDRRDLQAFAGADFALGRAGPKDAQRAQRRLAQAEGPPEPASPALPPDAESGCLVQGRGAAVAHAAAEPERLRTLVRRAGQAAWLPELRLRIDRRLGRSESLDLPARGAAGNAPLGLDTDDDVRWEARATWDLSRLVLGSEELAAESHAQRVADMRRELESTFNRLYFERRRLQVEAVLAPASEPDTHARRAVRVEELQAELDALSNGAFQRCLTDQARNTR